jgi:hypothetical protein
MDEALCEVVGALAEMLFEVAFCALDAWSEQTPASDEEN